MKRYNLTRKQFEIYEYLRDNLHKYPYPPTLKELCRDLGLHSRGSLHKQLQALVKEGLIEPMNHKKRGIRLVDQPERDVVPLPLHEKIAAGQPIEAIQSHEIIEIPTWMLSTAMRQDDCYVLRVEGDSMIEEGILDGDYVIIENRTEAENGEIVVALIDNESATLKRIEYKGRDKVILHPANRHMKSMEYPAHRIRIQGVLIGQMRRYRH